MGGGIRLAPGRVVVKLKKKMWSLCHHIQIAIHRKITKKIHILAKNGGMMPGVFRRSPAHPKKQKMCFLELAFFVLFDPQTGRLAGPGPKSGPSKTVQSQKNGTSHKPWSVEGIHKNASVMSHRVPKRILRDFMFY